MRYPIQSFFHTILSVTVFSVLVLGSISNSHSRNTLLTRLIEVETQAKAKEEPVFFGPKITVETYLRNLREKEEARLAEEYRIAEAIRVAQEQERLRQEELARVAAEQARQQAEAEQAKKLAEQKAREVIAQKTFARPAAVQAVAPKPVAMSGSKQDWMRQAGIPESDWMYVDYIVTRESGWNPNAVNAGSGATGLCQSLPASKMASAGGDYLTNPVTQLRWCDSYARQRYGGWRNSYNEWLIKKWW